MTGRQKYTVADTGAGWVGVLASDSGLLKLTLPQVTSRQAQRQLGGDLAGAVRDDAYFAGLVGRLRGYFSGRRVSFDDRLDLSAATAFQRRVWQLARLIPYGETRSYGWLAESLGRAGAGRAVGQALGRNRLPVIVPCHRVVAKDGSLGGYSGGLDRKISLLRLESGANDSG